MLDLARQHTFEGEVVDIYVYLSPNVYVYRLGSPLKLHENQLVETDKFTEAALKTMSDAHLKDRIKAFRSDMRALAAKKALAQQAKRKKKSSVKKAKPTKSGVPDARLPDLRGTT